MDKYQKYELEKRILQAKNLTPEKYAQEIQKLAKRLKI